MVSRKALMAVGGIAIAALALAGCSGSGTTSGSTSGSTSKDFLIYMNTPLTGPLSAAAQLNVDTLKATVAEINSNGGILGRHVDVVVADDQLDTSKAVTLLQEQISKQKPDLVFMGATSNEALALLPVLTRNKIISTAIVQSTAINDPKTYPYAFIPYQTAAAEAPAELAELQAEGVKKVAVLTANDANGQATADASEKAFTAAGIATSVEQYSPTDVDMTPQLQRLQAKNPDVLVIQAFGSATAHILASRTKLGWDIKTLGNSSIGLGQNLADISTSADWNNLYLGVFPVTAGQSPNPKVLSKIVAAVKAEGNPVTQSVHYVAIYWDAIHLFKQGFEQAGSTDADAAKAALENLKSDSSVDSQLVTWPVEDEKWSSTNHFFDVPSDKLLVYIKPGPIVDGVIQSEK